jgi:hypothetical protein
MGTSAVDTDRSTGRGLDNGALVYIVGQFDHQMQSRGDSLEPQSREMALERSDQSIEDTERIMLRLVKGSTGAGRVPRRRSRRKAQ